MATTLGLAAPRPRAATTAGALRTHLAAAAVGVAYALALLVLAGGIVPLPILAPGTFRPLPGRSFLWQPTAHLFLFVWWPTWLRAAGVGALVGWTAHRVASARPRAHPAWLLPAVAALLTGYTCCAMTVPAAGLWLHLHPAHPEAVAGVALAAVAAEAQARGIAGRRVSRGPSRHAADVCQRVGGA